MKVLVDVEAGPNTAEETQLVFLASAPPRPARAVRWDDGGGEALWELAGVASDGAFGPAQACPVEDSGGGVSWLVFGGGGGLRLRRPGPGAFSLLAAGQVGVPYLLLDAGAVELD